MGPVREEKQEKRRERKRRRRGREKKREEERGGGLHDPGSSSDPGCCSLDPWCVINCGRTREREPSTGACSLSDHRGGTHPGVGFTNLSVRIKKAALS